MAMPPYRMIRIRLAIFSRWFSFKMPFGSEFSIKNIIVITEEVNRKKISKNGIEQLVFCATIHGVVIKQHFKW